MTCTTVTLRPRTYFCHRLIMSVWVISDFPPGSLTMSNNKINCWRHFVDHHLTPHPNFFMTTPIPDQLLTSGLWVFSSSSWLRQQCLFKYVLSIDLERPFSTAVVIICLLFICQLNLGSVQREINMGFLVIGFLSYPRRLIILLALTGRVSLPTSCCSWQFWDGLLEEGEKKIKIRYFPIFHPGPDSERFEAGYFGEQLLCARLLERILHGTNPLDFEAGSDWKNHDDWYS